MLLAIEGLRSTICGNKPFNTAHHIAAVATFTLLTALAVGTAPSAKDAPATSVSPALHSEPALQQYRALRRMHARSEKFNHEGWMEAWTELDTKGFRYEIVSERGSDTVRKKCSGHCSSVSKNSWRPTSPSAPS